MSNVVVTGGSDKAGQAALRELIAHGHQVINVDLLPPPEPLGYFLKADLNDMEQTIEALRRAAGTLGRRRPFETADAVVHVAG